MTRSTGGKATISDVARAAGVSTATVSRALNDSSKVTEATKKKVEQAVRSTGFVMNAQGRALAVGRAESIGILVTEPLDEIFVDPTFSVILRGISEALAQTPFLPVIVQASTEFERERALRHFQRRSVDAVIDISPYTGDEVLEALSTMSLPVVLCGQLDDPRFEGVFSNVYADDEEGARIAGKAMLDRGRRRIGAILGPEDNPASVDRLVGYREVLGDALAPDGVVFAEAWDAAAGYAAARQILAKVPDLDGILAGSDRIASGVLDELEVRGISVPDTISVIGFDDHAVAQATTPPLTTVRQPLREEGGVAAQIAIDMIEGAHPRTVVMHTELIERDSL